MKNYKKLGQALMEADTERRKDADAAANRERAAEMRREERMRKIKYMQDMPDSQPAGTGKLNVCHLEFGLSSAYTNL